MARQPDENDEDTQDETNPEQDTSPHRHSGIRLGIGLRPVADLLRGLVDVDITHIDHDPDHQSAMPEARLDSEPTSTSSPSGKTDTSRSSTDYHIDVYEGEDEMTVVADLPGVAFDDLRVGLDEKRSDLVIIVKDTTIERISLPWKLVRVNTVMYNNEILEINLHPPGGNLDSLNE
ncbi:gas vesicle protein GvpH [Halegenticoccus tardaugens]|uniref:gas vesicle protein GvpH n=1 Tax=Halegenticoccus tardaugens TaxID=2071624 RepID=UPI0013E93421|nr:gas vesicle protein GvpH [Halegenticoccus tardaugens]